MAEEPQATPLVLGRPVERRIVPGERHSYEVRVEADQFLRVILERRGTEAWLALEEPTPGTNAERDPETGPYGTVEVFGMSASPGLARLFVRAPERGVAGSYRIVLQDLRAASASDRQKLEAQRVAGEANPNPQTLEARAQAIRTETEAIALYRQAHEDRGLAEQVYGLAFNQFYSGKAQEALALHREGLDLWRKLGDRAGAAAALNGMAMAHSYMADYPKAIEQYRSSLEIQEAIGDPWGQARVLSNMSIAYASLDEVDKARDCLERSLPLRRAAGDRRGEAYTLSNLADYNLGADRRRRLEMKTRAAELAAEAGDRMFEGAVIADIGRLQAVMGDEARAIETLDRARGILHEAGNTRVEGRTLSDIAVIQWRRGQLVEALARFSEALALHGRAKDRGGEALTYIRMGGVYEALRRDDEARAAIRRSLDLRRAMGSLVGVAEVLVAESRLDRRAGRSADARTRVNEAIEIIESMRARIARLEARALFFSSWQEAYRLSTELYLDAHTAAPQAGFDAMAFRETERARARGVVESVSEAKLNLADDLPENLRQREAELSAKLTDLQKRLAAAGDEGRALESEIFETETAWASLAVEIRSRSRRYAALRYPEAISAERARSLCDGETAIVSYALGEERSQVFVLTAARLTVSSLPVGYSKVSEIVSSYTGLLAAPKSAPAGDLGSRLEEELVEPWRKTLPAQIRKLVIVPDADLHSLPFEALPQPGRGGRRLIEDFVISYAPSVTVLAELSGAGRSRPAGQPVDVLAFGAPSSAAAFSGAGATFDGERVALGPLPETEREARSAVRFGGAGSRLRLGPDATERRLKEEPLERYGALHFATHTLLSASVPSRSALVLGAVEGDAEDGLLQAREIYRLRLQSDLVVLSGCRTARGTILAGEGVIGLTQAFFHAGAKTVVASFWDVSDRRTAELMELFYRRMAEGHPKAEALRAAKLDMLRRDPKLEPHDWAAFVLLGEPAGKLALKAPSFWQRLF